MIGSARGESIFPRPMMATIMFVICMGAQGCQRHTRQATYTYADFVKTLCDPLRVADLSTPQADIVTSFDTQGKNNDFNNFPHHRADAAEPGWVLLADLKGPGFLSRFWTTGGESADQRLKFYLDDEPTARIDATIAELRGGVFPYVPPLSRYEQSCWWSYAPMTYAKRLRILAKHDKTTHDGWPRLFFQINYSAFNKGFSVATLPAVFGDSDRQALAELAGLWSSSAKPRSPATAPLTTVAVPPGDEGITLPTLTGPAIIETLTLVPSDARRAKSLIIRIHWDDANTPAILLPLPILGGRLWDAPPYSTLYFSEQEGRTALRFPMPFRKSARITLLNRSPEAIDVQVGFETQPWATERQELGYLHTQWNRTSPQQLGQPHPILQTKGAKGKYTGAIVSVLSLDNSWWVLEGDESIRIDGETQAGWHGTGLEDYFNGGWYYKNNLARPLHGLVFKSLYKAVQYRLHRDDARRFEKSIDVSLERGPDNASQAWIESVSFYYSDDP
ncbi:MAG: DUF2961 domain-containing protein, partial [Verrucomicrobia bacterium]|nr:DUF2961 domain-containing protein [Verrucomicrobiota bacterium]